MWFGYVEAYALTGAASLWALALAEGLGWISMLGVGAIAALLAYEHRLVKPDDFSHVNAAFFTVNGYISVLFFVFWALDLALLR